MKTDVRSSIGERIAAAIERMGISQGELARRVGSRPETINRYITGKIVPSAEAIPPLADAMGMTTDELLRGERAGEVLHPMLVQFLGRTKGIASDHRRMLADLDPPADIDHTFYPNMYAAILHGMNTYKFQRELNVMSAENGAKAETSKPKKVVDIKSKKKH